MTDNYRNIITRHKRMLLSPDLKTKYGLDENMIVSAGTLPDLDEAYSRWVHFVHNYTVVLCRLKPKNRCHDLVMNMNSIPIVA